MSTTTIENRETFLRRLREYFSQIEIDEIMYAYDISKEAHRRFGRDTGERYFEHPRACALILLDELKFNNKDGVIILLLHDTGEDTPIFGSVTRSYIEFCRVARFRITKTFSRYIAEKLILLTKPCVDNVEFHSKEGAMKHYISSLCNDDEALFYKMIDRLHNLRTLNEKNHSKIQKAIDETKIVYLECFTRLISSLSVGKYAAQLLGKIKEELVSLEITYGNSSY